MNISYAAVLMPNPAQYEGKAVLELDIHTVDAIDDFRVLSEIEDKVTHITVTQTALASPLVGKRCVQSTLHA
jgi:hypothetical protein